MVKCLTSAARMWQQRDPKSCAMNMLRRIRTLNLLSHPNGVVNVERVVRRRRQHRQGKTEQLQLAFVFFAPSFLVSPPALPKNQNKLNIVL